ncbi:MAG: hypothetical protein L3J97_07780, partial [Thermoplasmata archaeon]|nr:hypothetical protein [Thermoplasmata archaeon]
RGLLFVGSSSQAHAADAILAVTLGTIQGKGGGTRQAATAVGEPGAPLEAALALARRTVLGADVTK